MPKKTSKAPINNLVIVSDTHSGCGISVLPPAGARLDDGGTYLPSNLQKKLWAFWEEFWGQFVPDATRNEPFTVLHNGDAIDGVHHGSTYQISQNLEDQSEIAFQLLEPIVALADGRYYHIRGTEAHVGKSGREEERLAKRLNAIPNQEGQYARYEIWKEVGDRVVHALHHVGTTGSQAYEATAVHKELTETYIEAARWGHRPPDAIVRSHRHRYIYTDIATEHVRAFAVVSPGWQGRTPFSWKIAGGRLSRPQFGGIVIRYAHNRLFCDPKVWTVAPSPVE